MHNTMKINYTTYDVRRAQDTINPNTDRRDIVLLSPEDADLPNHQYSYARVLGIYHVNAIYRDPAYQIIRPDGWNSYGCDGLQSKMMNLSREAGSGRGLIVYGFYR
jgi:hypothetical protein